MRAANATESAGCAMRASSRAGATPLEWCIRTRMRAEHQYRDVAAAASDAFVSVIKGHSDALDGWLVSRIIASALGHALSPAPTFIGVADQIPDEGLLGTTAKAVFDACMAELDPTVAPDLDALFTELERVLAIVPRHAQINSPVASCIAATFEGTRVRGNHAGAGCVRLMRSGTRAFEDLVIPHHLHRVLHRMPGMTGKQVADFLPMGSIIVSALGMSRTSGIGVDHFDVTLEPLDFLLVSSEPLPVDDPDLVRYIESSRGNLDAIADEIEVQLSRSSEANREFAFALVQPSVG